MNDPRMSPDSPAALGRLVRRAQASPLVAWLVFSLGVVLLLAWAGLSTAFVLERPSRTRSYEPAARTPG